MKSLRMNPDRSLYFKEMPIPVPRAGEVLIKMKYASICGFDIMMMRGKAAFPANGQLGHEGAGIVEAVGAGVSSAYVGEHVTINPYSYCGICPACRNNRSNFCINPKSQADLMSEYITINEKQVFEIPESLSLKAGSLMEPLMMAMHAVNKAHLRPGGSLLISGCGAMGQLILMVAHKMGAGKIVVTDPNEDKRRKALHFGADASFDSNSPNLITDLLLFSEGIGFDAVIEASGSRTAAQAALQLAGRGSTVVYFGLYGMDYELPVNLFNLYWSDGYITAVCVPSGYFPSVISMAEHLPIEEVITKVFPFEKGIEAFAEKASGGHAKVMLEFK